MEYGLYISHELPILPDFLISFKSLLETSGYGESTVIFLESRSNMATIWQRQFGWIFSPLFGKSSRENTLPQNWAHNPLHGLVFETARPPAHIHLYLVYPIWSHRSRRTTARWFCVSVRAIVLACDLRLLKYPSNWSAREFCS